MTNSRFYLASGKYSLTGKYNNSVAQIKVTGLKYHFKVTFHHIDLIEINLVNNHNKHISGLNFTLYNL